MELRSGRYIASGEARRRVELRRTTPVVPDHISDLPDDLLLLILARLGCVATAARTGVLARRWRGLWTRLLALVFPNIPFRSVKTALGAIRTAGGEVALLDIRVARATRQVTALLRSAAWLRLEELVLDVPSDLRNMFMHVDLPCFDRTTFISLSIGNGMYPAELRFPRVGAGGQHMFPALTTLVLSGYYVDDGLAALLPHCPRLRVLRYAVRNVWTSREDYAVTVHSATLRELVVEERTDLSRVDIATPMLNQLTLSCVATGDLNTVLIVAPMAEKVSWCCCHRIPTGFGCWRLEMVSLTSPAPAAETRRRPWLLSIHARKGIASGKLWMHKVNRLEKEVEKHLQLQVATDISVMDLELHLNSAGHVYGALVLHLLGIRRIRMALRRLKLALLPQYYREGGGCHPFCQCGSTEWRSQTISLTELELVEIHVFQGEDHQFEFLEVISRCAPMLRRVTVKTRENAVSIHARIRNIFKAHPSVECLVLSSE
ncbi:unnamed protein product [Alopecurus aequalis]